MLNRNELPINSVVREYQGKRSLTVLSGIRQSIPATAYPIFEIEPTSGANRWATTRAQRPRFSFTCSLSVTNSNEKFGVEYVTTLATVLSEVMCSPENLQLRILNETKWDPNSGLQATYMLDSLVEDISYSSSRDGTLRIAEFSWFVEVHEPFPETRWQLGLSTTPSVLRPKVVSI